MFKTDMRAFKNAMKLIAECPAQPSYDLRIHQNGGEWRVNTSTWKLLVPVECESSTEHTIIKISQESFQELFKGLRATKKEITVTLSENGLDLAFMSGEDVLVKITPLSIASRETRVIANQTVTSIKIDDMLSFLNSVYAFKSNKFTPIDARVEVHFNPEQIRFVHLTHIKMTQMIIPNSSKKDCQPIVIPTKELSIAYSLFKNSMEFDGEIQENDSVIIFATRRFKFGIKKEHQNLVSYDSLFNQNVTSSFRLGDSILNQLYAIKRNLEPLSEITINDKLVKLDSGKIKPTKDDLIVRINQSDSAVTIEPYLGRSTTEIGNVANGTMAFYDLSTIYEMTQAFVEPGFSASILENHAIRFENEARSVNIHLLPILPVRKDGEMESENSES